MTLLAEATFKGTVTGTDTAGGTFTGFVDPPATGHFTGTVSRARIERFDGTAVLYGATVLLDGVDVSADLVDAAVQLTDGIDNPFLRASFELEGSSYMPLVTEDTWTRAGSVTIKWQTGPTGDVEETTEFVGQVDQCSPSGRKRLRIAAIDQSYLYNNAKVCYELAPLSENTRGQIAGSLCQAAGMSPAAYDFPPGEVYTKAVAAGSRKLFDLLKDLGAPEGWSYRTGTDGVLEAYVPRMKLPPAAPDWEWGVSDLFQRPEVTPPNNVPSRWVVRGFSAVEEDETEQTVETTVYEVFATGAEAIAAQAVAVQEQDTAGNITSVTESPYAGTIRISRITDTVTKQGGSVIRHETVEEGWYNPRKGPYTTGVADGAGGAPQGLYYNAAYIDSDGEYVKWRRDKFVEIGRRIQEYTYTDSNLTELRVNTYGWFRRVQAWKNQDTDATPAFSNVSVGTDDVSYREVDSSGTIEQYGLRSRQIVDYTYDDDTGAVLLEEQDTYTYLPIEARTDSASGYVNHDGKGQTEETSTFKLTEREVKAVYLDESGRLAGDNVTVYAYVVPLMASGAGLYEYRSGDRSSNNTEAIWGIRNRKLREIQIESEDAYIEVTYDGPEGEKRQETRRLGPPPVPRYQSSIYFRLVQEPIEVEWEAAVLETWFGAETHVISNDWIQSEAEARSLLSRLRSRALSHEVRVSRPDSYARPGDTVLLVDREQGLAHRGLITERTRTRKLPRATAEYTVEVPLIPWVVS